MKRIGYDADTKVYTFRDHNGTIYHGTPGADYGTLAPVANTGDTLRPGAFESDEPRQVSSVNPEDRPSTFQDILPANLITATTSPVDRSLLPPTSPKISDDRDPASPRAQFVNVVRRTALPKMQGVVHNLRRSMTSIRRKGHGSQEDETLLRRGSSNLKRSASIATAHTGVSVNTPMLVNDRQ